MDGSAPSPATEGDESGDEPAAGGTLASDEALAALREKLTGN